MSSQKAVLKPYPIFNAITISSTQTSGSTNVWGIDFEYIVVVWSGGSSPVGSITVEVLYSDNDDWIPLDFASALSVSGNSGSMQIKLNSIPFTHVRIKYTRVSGTATLSAWIQGKGN